MQRARHGTPYSAWLLAAAALFALGCNPESSAPPPPATLESAQSDRVDPDATPEVAQAPGEKPATGSDAANYSGHSEAPAALAEDVPLYAQAVPISSMTSPSRGTIVSLRSEDTAELISAWYGTELPARGWRLERQGGAAGSHLIIANKDGRKATVLVTAGAQGTQILLTVLEDR